MRERERWTFQVEAGGPPSARPSSCVCICTRVQADDEYRVRYYVPEERSLRIRARASVLRLPAPDAELVVHAHHDR